MPRFLNRMLRNGARPFLSTSPRTAEPEVGNFKEGPGPVNTPGRFSPDDHRGKENAESAGDRPSEIDQIPQTELPGRLQRDTNTVQKRTDQLPGLVEKVDHTPRIVLNAEPEPSAAVEKYTEDYSKDENIVAGSYEISKDTPDPEQKVNGNLVDKGRAEAENGFVSDPNDDDRAYDPGNFSSEGRFVEKIPSLAAEETGQQGNSRVPQGMPEIPTGRVSESRVPVFVDPGPEGRSIPGQKENRQGATKTETRSGAGESGSDLLLESNHKKGPETKAEPVIEKAIGQESVIVQAGKRRRSSAGNEGGSKMTINRIDIQIINGQSPQPVQKIEAPRPEKQSPEIHELLDRRHVRHSLMDY